MSTPAPEQVCKTIRALTRAQHYPPTLAELCVALEVPSKSRMHRLLLRLRSQGLIEFDSRRRRTLRVNGQRGDAV